MQMSGVLGLLVLVALAAPAALAGPATAVDRLRGPDEMCQTCLVAVHMLEDALCDPAATDFLVQMMEQQVCPLLGDGAKCHNIAEGLVPVIIQWFRSAATPATLCASAGVCSGAALSAPYLNQPALRLGDDSSRCAMCTYAVTAAKKALDDSHIVEQALDEALKVCNQLPADLAGACVQVLDTYEPMLVTFLANLQPGQVCELVGACAQRLAAHFRPVPLPPAAVRVLAAVQRVSASHPLWAPRGGPAPNALVSGPSNDQCDVCKMAVLEAHSLVTNPSIQADLLNYTMALCDGLPGVTADCKLYVAAYAPLVFSLLDTYLVGDVLCVEIGVCPAGPTPIPPAEQPSTADSWVAAAWRLAASFFGGPLPAGGGGAGVSALGRAAGSGRRPQ